MTTLNKSDYSKKLDVFERQGVAKIPQSTFSEHAKDAIAAQTKAQSLKEAKAKKELAARRSKDMEKWSVYIDPSSKKKLRLHAVRNKMEDYMVLDEAVNEYIENHKIKD